MTVLDATQARCSLSDPRCRLSNLIGEATQAD